jgi:transcriptional regulator with XRE-family HTH domain
MPNKETLDGYIRKRCLTLGISMSDLSRLSGLSRQTLHSLAQVPHKMPALPTLIGLADTLKVHPLRLVHLVFSDGGLPAHVPGRQRRNDHSVFVADVTFADGALVMPNQRFTKTWELQNVGKVAWIGRTLQCLDEEVQVSTRAGEVLRLAHNLCPAQTCVPVPDTLPGELVQISVDFTAPEPPGTVLSYWKSTFADGSLCFPKSRGLWVKVRVTSMAFGALQER